MRAMTDHDHLDLVISESKIKTAIYRYCASIDRSMFQWMDAVFHDDAAIIVGRNESSMAEFIQSLQSRQAEVVRCVHSVSNILIEHLDCDRAFVESYCLAVEQNAGDLPGHDMDRSVRLRYVDIFERRANIWKIARRTLIVDHAMAPVPSATTKQFGGAKGARGPDDLAVSLRFSLGLDQ